MSKERLVVLTGPLQEKSFDIVEPITMGRNPENVIHLDDLQVSRMHAVVEPTSSGALLRDLGSGNGTYVGDRRILEYQLSHGDIIHIGTQELRFEGEPKVMDRTPVGLLRDPHEKSRSMVRFETSAELSVEAADAENMYETIFHASQDTASEDQLRDAQKRLQAIYQANQTISSERNLGKLFERVMDQIFALVPAHNGVIFLKDTATGEWVEEYEKSGLEGQEIIVSSSIINRAFDNGEAVLTCDAAGDSRFGAGASIITQNISSAMCVPLRHQDARLGVVYVDTRGTTNAFNTGDLELLVALAGPAAIAIKNAQYLREIQRAYEDTLIVLSNAIELRDHYTVGHTVRVTNVSVEIARALGWDEEKLDEVRMGGVLHDVGKIAVDDAILRKPDRLTDEEYAKMKIHPQRGEDLLRDVDFLHPLIPYCLYHHERYDGKGYPFGMKGDDIPMEGRVISVADTFDAMTSNRPYRKGLDPEIAIAELEKGKGSQFDPDCVDAMVASYRSGRINSLLQDFHKDATSIACPFCSTQIPIPEGTQAGENFTCHVCQRIIGLKEKNNAFYGELLPQSAANNTTPRPISGAQPAQE